MKFNVNEHLTKSIRLAEKGDLQVGHNHSVVLKYLTVTFQPYILSVQGARLREPKALVHISLSHYLAGGAAASQRKAQAVSAACVRCSLW